MPEENRNPFDETSLEGIDPEWIRVVQEYESRLGLLPMNNSLEILCPGTFKNSSIAL